jgi:hypothetical protein
MVLCGCKTKHVTEQRIDSVVKEVYSIKDSVRNETIFEYETIYDTVRKEYITNIKRIIAVESQNKTLQGTKDVKVSKDTKEVVKEPTKSLNRFWWVLLIFGGIIGFLIRK